MSTQKAQKPRPNIALFTLRMNEGWSRYQVGRQAGVTAETVRLAEKGLTVPNADTQHRIAGVFGKKPLDLWPLDRQRIAA